MDLAEEIDIKHSRWMTMRVSHNSGHPLYYHWASHTTSKYNLEAGAQIKQRATILISDSYSCFVELEGFEPSSKRGNDKVSTCLVSTWFSTAGRLVTTNLRLILWISGSARGLPHPISDIPAPPFRNASERGQSGDVSSQPALGWDKADLLYFDQAARA